MKSFKSEIRISNIETNSKFEFSNVLNVPYFGHLNFDHSDLFRISYFDIRILTLCIFSNLR